MPATGYTLRARDYPAVPSCGLPYRAHHDGSRAMRSRVMVPSTLAACRLGTYGLTHARLDLERISWHWLGYFLCLPHEHLATGKSSQQTQGSNCQRARWSKVYIIIVYQTEPPASPSPWPLPSGSAAPLLLGAFRAASSAAAAVAALGANGSRFAADCAVPAQTSSGLYAAKSGVRGYSGKMPSDQTCACSYGHATVVLHGQPMCGLRDTRATGMTAGILRALWATYGMLLIRGWGCLFFGGQ